MLGILINDIDANGGCEVVTKRIKSVFDNRGINVKILSLKSSNNKNYLSINNSSKYILSGKEINAVCNILKNNKINKLIVQVDGPLSPVFCPRLIKQLNQEFDVFFVLHNSPRSFIKCYGLNKLYTLKSFVRCLKIILFNIPQNKYRFRIAKNNHIKFITLAEQSKKELKECFGIDSTVIENQPIIVEYNEKECKEINQMLYVGRFDLYQKNIILLLDAWNKVEKGEWNLTLIGNGPDYLYVRNYARKKKIKNISFVNGIKNSEVLNILKNSKVLILSSNYEGFPTVFVEAMATNNAIITTNYDGIDYKIMKDGENCIIVDKNSFFLADAINTVIKDEKILKYMQEKCRECYNKMIETNIIEKWEKVLGYE